MSVPRSLRGTVTWLSVTVRDTAARSILSKVYRFGELYLTFTDRMSRDGVACGSSGYSAAARRSDSESRSAAASTAGACIRPGWRDSRSSGPDTDTAAMTLPLGERTGAETDATPCSRSPMDWAQPRRRMPASAAALNVAL